MVFWYFLFLYFFYIKIHFLACTLCVECNIRVKLELITHFGGKEGQAMGMRSPESHLIKSCAAIGPLELDIYMWVVSTALTKLVFLLFLLF